MLRIKARKKYKAIILEGITFAKLDFPLNWYKRLGIQQSKNLMFISGQVNIVLKKLKKR